MRITRPKQQTPEELVDGLMSVVFTNFYKNSGANWNEQKAFIKQKVVLWPATWLNKKGVTLPPERYHEIMTKLFIEIKVNVAVQVVNYWPGYLKMCVQRHFNIQGQKYYEEAKNIRQQAENVFSGISRAKETITVDAIGAMAAAHAVLTEKNKKKVKTVAKAKEKQGVLF